MNLTAGAVFGILIILFYLLSVMNYIVKMINRTYGKAMKTREKSYRRYTRFMRFIVRNHRMFGAIAVLLLVVHVIIQYADYRYISPPGAGAAVILILQAVLGGYGSRLKNKRGAWLTAHRTVAILLPVAMAVHVFL